MNSNRYLEKIAENLFSHSTSDDALAKMLLSGHLKSVKHIAKDSPDQILNVETSLIPFLRKSLTAESAVEQMTSRKNPDKIFLAMASYIPNYGDNVIVKRLSHPTQHKSLNTIPNEYTTSRKLSLKHNASIYVPDDRIEEYKALHPGFNFLPKSEIPLERIGLKERLQNYPEKVLDFFKKESSISPKSLSRNAILGGSVGLGINTDLSDTDIFIPYKNQHHYEKAVSRIQEKYPELKERNTTLGKAEKTSLTGIVNGKEVDVVLGLGEKAIRYADRYKNLQLSLTPEEKLKIIEEKNRLKNAWFMPGLRYKAYKNELAKELGLKQLYF